jgi:mannose-6-phosphate isomerase-like protein (cupin superfamily)
MVARQQRPRAIQRHQASNQRSRLRDHPDSRGQRTRCGVPEAQASQRRVIYVIEGSIEYAVEGKPPATVNAGEVLFIPAGTIHAAGNVGSANAAELGTYVAEKGKPLVELVK